MDTQTNGSGKCKFTSSDALIGVWLTLYFLLVPFFIFILYVGYTQRKKQSGWSHSDVLTFNIIPMELLSILGTFIYVIADQGWIQEKIANYLYNISMSGQMFIHAFTCVDRYLAVVHPITYLRLKKRGGIRIRNISIIAAWVFSVGLKSVSKVLKNEHFDLIYNIIFGCLILAVVTFCSISVLCTLLRPGPGERGKDVKHNDQLKKRAFFILKVIMGVLLLRFVAFIVDYLASMRNLLGEYDYCVFIFSLSLLTFPSSLVLPLIFLQKTGKLPKCSIMNCKLQLKKQISVR